MAVSQIGLLRSRKVWPLTVPLYAILQEAAAPARRSRMISANNVMNAVFMVVGSAAAGLAARRIDAPGVLYVAAGANLLVAARIVVGSARKAVAPEIH